jgi:hypothetical protein
MIQCSWQVIRTALPERTSHQKLLVMTQPRLTARITELPILGERDTNFTEFSGSSKINRQRDGTPGTYQNAGR